MAPELEALRNLWQITPDPSEQTRADARARLFDAINGGNGSVAVHARLDPRRPLRRRRRSAAILVAAAGAAIVLALATPLGAGIARSLSGFSSWITGQPGSPAPQADQRAFARANARTWLGFPDGTQLRLLDTTTDPTGGERVELLGFRSGGTLCLRLNLTGETAGTAQSCAPLAELRRSGAPARVILVDNGFGTGKQQEWYGLERLHSPALQVTAGIAADNVRTVTLTDQAGTHTVRTSGNAFLYVAWHPAIGQRVTQISAQTSSGRVAVPFAQVPFLFGAGGSAAKASFGPTSVQRHMSGGRIGWLDRRQPRGQPLDVLPKRTEGLSFSHAVFGRVITPDPSQPIRVAVAASTSSHGGRAIGVCTAVIVQDGGGSGCQRRAQLFAHGPLGTGFMLSGGSDQFALVEGLASDDVAKIVAFLANRHTQPVPLTDNVYAVQIARTKLPAELVAYDTHGRIIGITPVNATPGSARPTPAPGRPRQLLHVTSATGATATLYTGPSSDGGKCMYVRWYQSKHATGQTGGCNTLTAHRPAITLSGGGPTGIWQGQARTDVKTVELRFADGSHTSIKPTDGFILYALNRSQLTSGGLTKAIARDAARKDVGHETLKPTKR
ncbi:MAG: hypothetical protein ACJ74N_17100 [Gaiellaceae bacterium]